jgi:hypothetical protein
MATQLIGAPYLRSIGLEYVPAKTELKCEECNGHGFTTMDGHEIDCEECDGTGYFEPTDFEIMDRAALGQAYADTIGYDPFDDDPTIGEDEVRQILREYELERFS